MATPTVKEAEILLLLLLSKLPSSDKTEILSVKKQARVYANSVFSSLPHYTTVSVLIDLIFDQEKTHVCNLILLVASWLVEK